MKRFITTLVLALAAVASFAVPAKKFSVYKATDEQITYIGRTVAGEDGSVSFNWTATTVRISFTGSYLAIVASDTHKNYYDVWVDSTTGCEATREIATSGADSVIVIFNGKKGEHNVILRRRTEGEQGVTTFKEVHVGGFLTQAEPVRERFLEFIGDSYTCGYGTEGKSASEHFTPETENSNYAYGAIVSRYFDADYVAIAHSGRGIVRNYGGHQDPCMPELYMRTFDYPGSSNSEAWDFTKGPKPAATIIMLGTNDFSTGCQPTLDSWCKAYAVLLGEIKAAYGQEHPILCCAARGNADMLVYVRAAVERAGYKNVTFMGHGKSVFPDEELGCDSHPNYQGEKRYARAIIPYISTITGWPLKDNIR